jgi:RimJ/RimL family protein N-acetyltransferase
MSFPANTSHHDALALADGSRLRLRPIDSGDRARVASLFARLSPESRYRQSRSPKSELTPRELSYLAEVDQVHHVVIAAVDESSGSIVGVSRYVQPADRPGTAGVAVVVIDELHGMGVGTALARRTAERACANGLVHLTATTRWEDRAARGRLRKLRFRVQASNCHEIEHLLELNCVASWILLLRKSAT